MSRPRTPRVREVFDEPWKRALRAFLPEFVQLFHPRLHAKVDWTFEPVPEPREAELDANTKHATDGRRSGDLVFKLRLRDGNELFLVVYLEVQAHRRGGFEALVFRRFLRLFERHPLPIETIVILTDRSRSWRPKGFIRRGVSSFVALRFKTIKILDWEDREDELRASDNPFAAFVLAVLAVLRTRPDAARATEKTAVIRHLLKKGFANQRIRDLFLAVDQVMRLGAELEREVWTTISHELEVPEMPYMMIFERDAMEKGKAEGKAEGKADAVIRFLSTRFGPLGTALVERIQSISNLARLDTLIEHAVRAPTLAEFERELASP